jgi:transcriptional regulator with XRE-family HTH domain
MTIDPAKLLQAARAGAGLSQRELAARAGTSQSVVARIELGATSPTWDTLSRLLRAADVELEPRLIRRPVSGSHMLDDVARIRALSPMDRLREAANVDRFLRGARRA